MIMRSYSEKEMKDLRCTFEKTVLSWSHVTQKKTFGCPSYQADGKTFAILVTKGVLITKIDQAVKDTLPDQHQNGAIHTCKKNIEHWVRVPINDEAEMEKIMHIVKKSSEIVLQEE
jgi:predicted DNA-binding protein (MmcQ/YjbR family)